jgi:hypothetical protein
VGCRRGRPSTAAAAGRDLISCRRRLPRFPERRGIRWWSGRSCSDRNRCLFPRGRRCGGCLRRCRNHWSRSCYHFVELPQEWGSDPGGLSRHRSPLGSCRCYGRCGNRHSSCHRRGAAAAVDAATAVARGRQSGPLPPQRPGCRPSSPTGRLQQVPATLQS